MSVFVVRAFIRLRETFAAHQELAAKLDVLERKVGAHDGAITELLSAVRQLMAPPEAKKRRIGFISDDEAAK